jgi:hypothetical protein
VAAAPAPAPAPAPYPAYPYRSPWWLFRLLCLVAAVCAFIAALEFSRILNGGDGLGMAWLAGAVSAFFLAWAIP